MQIVADALLASDLDELRSPHFLLGSNQVHISRFG